MVKTLGLFFLLSLPAQAVLILSNWNITGNTVSFDITGSIPDVPLGDTDLNVLYVGEPGNTSWITADSTSRTIINNGGGNTTVRTNTGVYDDNPAGDYINFNQTNVFDDWAVGDSIDASFSYSGGTLIGANINPANIIISAGYNAPLTIYPDPSTQVGAIIPEPGATGLLVGAFLLFWAYKRRQL
jgi:hypothetical protein